LGLIQGGDGNFYGVTALGGYSGSSCGPDGNYGCGTIFKLTPQGTLTTIHQFCSPTGCTDGKIAGQTNMALIQGSDGNFYGTTEFGGNASVGACTISDGCGTIFEITSAGAFTTLYTFCSQTNCDGGFWPYGGLIQGSDGSFYGTTGVGGLGSVSSAGYAGGVFFRITSDGVLTPLYGFCGQDPCANGDGPNANVVEGKDGTFYGTTGSGGLTSGTCTDSEGCGTFFKITPGGEITTLYDFCSLANCADGFGPTTGLYLATDGNYYGATGFGGAAGITPQINSAYRNASAQQRMRNGGSGKRPAAFWSWHEVGMAVDINPAGKSFPIIKRVMLSNGFTWGGGFRSPDTPHFQLAAAGTSPALTDFWLWLWSQP
jgi:uncharacterized repeat protein (TIGR03803 family)